MIVTEERYKLWQSRLLASKIFYWFWVWWGIYSILIFLAIGLYLAPTAVGRKVLGLALVSFVVARFVVCEIIYHFYKRQRPYQAFRFTQPSSVLFSNTTKLFNSFPSGHATSVAALAVVLYMQYPYLGLVALITSVFTSMGRVVLGYHYVSDIVVGFAIGTITALLTWFLLSPHLFT